MKIVLTGAGGGHFYPLIAVAERIRQEVLQQKIIDAEMYFFSDQIYDETTLKENNISFIKIPAGKITVYFSFQNFLSPILALMGFLISLVRLFIIYPDLVFAKGGYSSFPVILAAKCLFIPVFIHESDSVPGRTTKLMGHFAQRIAVSYAAAVKYFDITKIAHTGQPIMKKYLPTAKLLEEKLERQKEYAKENIRRNILILGGSQGAEKINNLILENLPTLLEKYNVIHQVGQNNLSKIKIASEVILKDNIQKENYHYFAFDNLAKYYLQSDLCITRAGSTLFELSAWGIPSIIIPIAQSNGDHQRQNAFLFAGVGCSVIIEEINFTSNILLNNIDLIFSDQKKYIEMQNNNLKSFKAGAAEIIAKEIVKIGLSHNS